MNRPKLNDVLFDDPEGFTDMTKYSEGLDKYIDYLESLNKFTMKKETSNNNKTKALNIGVLISRFFFNERMWLKVGRDKAEPEKAVFLTILFINTNHESFTDLRHRGFILCVGWWDYSIKLGLFF